MWDAVKFTQAGQVARLFDLSDEARALLDDRDTPEGFFNLLKDAGAQDDAMAFLSFALPRRQAIAWGRDCVNKTGRSVTLTLADTAATSAVAAWLDDPSEERRWTAHAAAMDAGLTTAEAMLAFSVYVSGGSLAPPNCPQPVQPAPDLAGRIVFGAVLIAAVRVVPQLIADTKAGFLDRGVAYARGTA